MSRIALLVSYDGAGFEGWQTQPSGRAVQDQLEQALSTIAGEAVATVCAGRTDAGVHAIAQVVHFDAPRARPLSAWVRGTNALLPETMGVRAAFEVDSSFHARFSALQRHYLYLLHPSSTREPLLRQRVGWTWRAIDVDRMQAAARLLVGTHDFSSFRSSQCQARNPVRTLGRFDVDSHGGLVRLRISGNGFLHHMVRNMTGALVAIGSGVREPAWMGELLSARDRRLGPATFSAAGLYLAGVDYDPGFGLPVGGRNLDDWMPMSIPGTGTGSREAGRA